MAPGKHSLTHGNGLAVRPEHGKVRGDTRLEKLWKIGVAATTVAFVVAVGLVAALVLGWNNPRPAGPPDWRADNLPILVNAPEEGSVVHLMDWSASDFGLEAEISILGFNRIGGAGLIYGAENVDRYTVFSVGSDGYYAVHRVEGADVEVLIPWQQFPHINRGAESNLLRVSCCGATCQFFINDEYAASIANPSRKVGQIGLWASGDGNDGIIVSFTEIQAWQSCE
ncbi:MAG: hypothetical protein MUQ10_04025 [Anaerolineae bacterium]|nr:hypothetical protein [Anaerolineae bacterium]